MGITATGPKSRLRAVEVHLFPESMRGVGEGHYDWDLEPGSSMTNGNIDGEVASANGRSSQSATRAEHLRLPCRQMYRL